MRVELSKEACPLARLGPGQRGQIQRVDGLESEMRRYLATLGVIPGTELAVEQVAPFGGPLLVRIGRARYALGRKVAQSITVSQGAWAIAPATGEAG